MKCECLFSYDICRAVSSYLYSSLNILASDKFDTFSSNFYQHQVILSLPGKNDVTYKSIERVVVG